MAGLHPIAHDKSLVAVQDAWSPHCTRFVQITASVAPVPLAQLAAALVLQPLQLHAPSGVTSADMPVSRVEPGRIAELEALLKRIQSGRLSQPTKADARSLKAQVEVLSVTMALAADSRFKDTPIDDLLRQAAEASRLLWNKYRKKRKTRGMRGQEDSAVGNGRRDGARATIGRRGRRVRAGAGCGTCWAR